MNLKLLSALSVIVLFSSFTHTANAQFGWGSGYQSGNRNIPGLQANSGWMGFGPGRGPRMLDPIGTVSITADLNFDGLIRGSETGKWTQNNPGKLTPPGLVIGTNEMAKVLLSAIPSPVYLPQIGSPKVNMKFHKLALILDVRGVDLGKKNGQFRSLDSEIEKCGRILVWADKSRQRLLLDSSDASKRRLVWAYADSVPLPHVYVEGVDAAQPGGAYLITWELDDSFGQNAFQRFFGQPAVWDRLMVSIRPTGFQKPLIDNDPVWIKFSQPNYSKLK